MHLKGIKIIGRIAPTVLYCLGCLLLGICVGLARTPAVSTAKDPILASSAGFFDLGEPEAFETNAPVPREPEKDPGSVETSSNESTGRAVKPSPKLVTYVVQQGDTLSAIARKFDTTPDSIAYINNLSSLDRIVTGTELSIIQGASGVVKRVEPGDTLWDISICYGVSVNDIVEANDILDPNDLREGQLLIIPNAKLTPMPQAKTASRSDTLSWPLSGIISSPFGWRSHPISGDSRYHEGIDIAATSGTPVGAAAAGTVTHASWLGGYGRLVIISHGNGLETRYGHLSSYAVNVGQKVKAGDVIGYVGQSGDATGPHCHFEVRKDGQVQNPRSYLP